MVSKMLLWTEKQKGHVKTWPEKKTETVTLSGTVYRKAKCPRLARLNHSKLPHPF